MRNPNGLNAGVRTLLEASGDGIANQPLQAEISSPGDPDVIGWSHGGDFAVSLLPIMSVLCVGVGMTAFSRAPQVRPGYSTTLALGAVLLWFVKLAYFKADSQYTSAIVVYGLLNSLTPLSIVFGAVCLVQTMQATKVRHQIPLQPIQKSTLYEEFAIKLVVRISLIAGLAREARCKWVVCSVCHASQPPCVSLAVETQLQRSSL